MQLLWIKAYTGIEGNEEADTERATERTHKVHTRIPECYIKSSVNKITVNWQASWDMAKTGRCTYKLIKEINVKRQGCNSV